MKQIGTPLSRKSKVTKFNLHFFYFYSNIYIVYGELYNGDNIQPSFDDSVTTDEKLLTLLTSITQRLDQIEATLRNSSVEYDVKVYRNDSVLESETDKRGYPKSCGKVNANKRIVVIVRGD